MSGVYINDIEMPTSGHILIVFPSGRVLEVSADSKQDIFREAKAVPIPPHQDLIERKAIYLTDFEIVMCGGDYKDGMRMLLEKVESAPTIIPASKEQQDLEDLVERLIKKGKEENQNVLQIKKLY